MFQTTNQQLYNWYLGHCDPLGATMAPPGSRTVTLPRPIGAACGGEVTVEAPGLASRSHQMVDIQYQTWYGKMVGWFTVLLILRMYVCMYVL